LVISIISRNTPQHLLRPGFNFQLSTFTACHTMNCREAQPQIYAERDGALDSVQRAALDGHLAHCEACRRIRDDLTSALTAWRTEALNVTVPDAEREWHAVRRRIRGGSESGAAPTSGRRRTFSAWLALPLGAAAAVAFALLVVPDTAPSTAESATAIAHIGRANSVEAPGNNASTTVFVDEKSGWLIVWASDADPKQG
jgi:hypothetical protein